jgi:hypothetical protein
VLRSNGRRRAGVGDRVTLVLRGDGEHPDPTRGGQLHDREADAAGRPGHQNGLARGGRGALEHPYRGAVGRGQAGQLLVA